MLNKSNLTVNLRYALKTGVFNFNLVRIILALMVILGHSYDIFLGAGVLESDPIWMITKFTYAGHAAVLLFFFLSGFLVNASVKKNSPLIFVLHRLIRVYPAFIINVLFSIVLGYILTTSEGSTYCRSAFTYLGNLLLLPGSMSFEISGVFSENKLKLFNVVIWTLPYEIICYSLLLTTSILLNVRNAVCKLFLIVGWLYFSFVNYDFFKGQFLGGNVELVCFFIAGCILEQVSVYININKKQIFALTFVVASSFLCLRNIINEAWILFYLSFYLFMILLFCCIAISFNLRWTSENDISYGIYIYGFIIQQVFASKFPTMSPIESLMPTVVVTGLLALLSWRCIELRALNLVKTSKI
jgi:peptidoglycan/LPS O-acetylase OafA/YrhL